MEQLWSGTVYSEGDVYKRQDEELVQMTVECNNIQFDICINRADLLGDPAVGRRFKGTIWLQGQLHF